jgi:cytochrome P450
MQKLTLHPTCQARLRKELRETLPSNSLDRNFAMIDKLTYLNATVMEALRVVTTIETYQPRVVPACGCSIEGYYIPGGTIVSSQPYLMNNHPAVFPSPWTFDPDRWLLSQEDYRALRKRLFTFSSGPRSCLGREFAIASMFDALLLQLSSH